MTWYEALILGIVEGLTEYLPVSSTGHLILTQWLLGLNADPQTEAAVNSFNIIVQAGAIAAVLGLYRQRVGQMIRGLLGRDEEGRRLALMLIAAFMPAAVLGVLLADPIERHLFAPWPVIAALAAGGLLMLGVARWRRGADEADGKEVEQIDLRMALLIGFAQCLAMWPGTSRSMMTIVAAFLVGLRPRAAAEFSFLLGLVTLGAATVYKSAQGGTQMVEQLGAFPILVGLVGATVSAALAVKWFVRFLTRNGLAPFGWYRLALSAVLAGLILSGVMEGF
ncbi:undecaprenyl-diphosphate phosphatase [Phycisphaera mikurensis]|uniref:Undecaprenyl-diphosphatase n=1 Tax=Phycisphaera mikurensis (strain NBRC 102666 / KCTC 22515 / FYK2301M01) TaxID=1142394 RepID=I0IED0_PHYMF|nr:undecaprenyl-diphosphate phosphatase [Phycisphaera mikurensis]MBB6441418.1 undecaprenyl-diphosphatase [Phycisphaera mikurensis]BAM03618.1 undecaprenyl-diphosphatase [Phycisphaera mikurensis NBRC 102666]